MVIANMEVEKMGCYYMNVELQRSLAALIHALGAPEVILPWDVKALTIYRRIMTRASKETARAVPTRWRGFFVT